jgi:hypothetical protein
MKSAPVFSLVALFAGSLLLLGEPLGLDFLTFVGEVPGWLLLWLS